MKLSKTSDSDSGRRRRKEAQLHEIRGAGLILHLSLMDAMQALTQVPRSYRRSIPARGREILREDADRLISKLHTLIDDLDDPAPKVDHGAS